MTPKSAGSSKLPVICHPDFFIMIVWVPCGGLVRVWATAIWPPKLPLIPGTGPRQCECSAAVFGPMTQTWADSSAGVFGGRYFGGDIMSSFEETVSILCMATIS